MRASSAGGVRCGLVLGVDEFLYCLAEVGDQVAELVDAGFGEPLEERLVVSGRGGVDAVERCAAGRGQVEQLSAVACGVCTPDTVSATASMTAAAANWHADRTIALIPRRARYRSM